MRMAYMGRSMKGCRVLFGHCILTSTMSGGLDIGQIPDRPTTPSSSSQASQYDGDAKARVIRDEDVADGETKPSKSTGNGDDDAEVGEKTAAASDSPSAPKKKAKKPAVDYVRPDAGPNKVDLNARLVGFQNLCTDSPTNIPDQALS